MFSLTYMFPGTWKKVWVLFNVLILCYRDVSVVDPKWLYEIEPDYFKRKFLFVLPKFSNMKCTR